MRSVLRAPVITITREKCFDNYRFQGGRERNYRDRSIIIDATTERWLSMELSIRIINLFWNIFLNNAQRINRIDEILLKKNKKKKRNIHIALEHLKNYKGDFTMRVTRRR